MQSHAVLYAICYGLDHLRNGPGIFGQTSDQIRVRPEVPFCLSNMYLRAGNSRRVGKAADVVGMHVGEHDVGRGLRLQITPGLPGVSRL